MPQVPPRRLLRPFARISRRAAAPALSLMLALFPLPSGNAGAAGGMPCPDAKHHRLQCPDAPMSRPRLNPSALEPLRRRIVSGDLPNVHSLLVQQDGRPVVSWYFRGDDQRGGHPLGPVRFGASILHDTRSVTKSVVALLLGIALRDGEVTSLDEPALDYFPDYSDLRTPERMRIRLRDLVTMRSGLDWDEDSYPYSDPRNSDTAMEKAPDRLRYVLGRQIVARPGTRFRYSGGDAALIGAILARATKVPLDVYAARKLFAPLGITRHDWLKDLGGAPNASSGLRLLPRDMVKIGQLMLDGGRAGGRQVVPASWITAASRQEAVVNDDPRCGMRYGYFWWVSQGCITEPRTPWIAAIGNGGQRLWVVPSRRLVVVLTQGLYDDAAGSDRNAGAIFGAILGNKPAPDPGSRSSAFSPAAGRGRRTGR